MKKLKRERLLNAAILVMGICALLFCSGGLVSAQLLNCEGPCKCMDIVLVVDDTGSMGGAIANVQLGLADIIAAAQEASIGPAGEDLCLRMGLVSFKDDIEVDQALTEDMTLVENAVNALSAGGGGPEPEASDEAVRYVVTGAASADCTVTGDPPGIGAFRDSTNVECEALNKIIVLVTDARPGGCDNLYQVGVDDVNANEVAELAFAADPIVISAVFVPTDPNGIYFETIRPIMQYYATATGGVFSEVGGDGSGTGAAIEEIIAACGGPPGECAECPESPECPECDGLDPDAMREEFNEMRSYMEGLRESLRNRLRR